MSEKIKNQTPKTDQINEPRVFARQVAYELTNEQLLQVSGTGGKCRRTPEKGDFICEI